MDVFTALETTATDSLTSFDNDELVTIAEAARRLGIHRPKLSVLVKAAGVEKTSLQGKEMIVFGEAVRVHDEAVDTGRIQPDRRQSFPQIMGATAADRPVFQTENQMRDSIELLMDHFRTEIARLQLERNDLAERVHGLESENATLKAQWSVHSTPPVIPTGMEPLELVQAVVDHTLSLIRNSTPC